MTLNRVGGFFKPGAREKRGHGRSFAWRGPLVTGP